MNFFPIVERELRIRARKPRTYWGRTYWVLLAMLFIAPHLLSGSAWVDPSAIGKDMFHGLLIAAFCLSSVACLWTSDLISSERREGTLGLLLLTRVRTFDVLLGKLGSAGAGSLCALITFLPVLVVPILAGGVTGGEAFRKGIVLLNTLGFSLVVGLWASTRAADSFRTAGIALLVVILPMVFLAGLEAFARSCGMATSGVGLISPLTSLLAAGDLRYKTEPGTFWTSVALTIAASLAFVGAASRNLRHRVDPPVGEPRSGANAATTMVSCWRRAGRGNDDPLAWLIQRQPGQRALIWTAASVFWFYAFVLSFFHWFGFSGWGYVVTWPFGVVMSICTDALIARAASRFLIDAKTNGELEILLTTTLGTETIVNSHWRAMRRLLNVPVIISIVTGTGWLALILATAPGLTSDDLGWKLQYAIGWALSALSCLVGVGAVCWLALYFAVRGHRQLGIIVRTAGLTTGVPYLARTVLLLGMQVLFFTGAIRSNFWVIISWLEACAITLFYLWLIGRARRGVMLALGAEPNRYRRRESLLTLIRDGLAALREVRYWTPS